METDISKTIMVFSTSVSGENSIQEFGWVLNRHPEIADWNIDLQDVDNVLRVEAMDGLLEYEVIDIMKTFGFSCEALPD